MDFLRVVTALHGVEHSCEWSAPFIPEGSHFPQVFMGASPRSALHDQQRSQFTRFWSALHVVGCAPCPAHAQEDLQRSGQWSALPSEHFRTPGSAHERSKALRRKSAPLDRSTSVERSLPGAGSARSAPPWRAPLGACPLWYHHGGSSFRQSVSPHPQNSLLSGDDTR